MSAKELDACAECSGRGWVRPSSRAAWVKCKPCYGSGSNGTPAPNEILTSNGTISRGRHVMYMPAKPKPPELGLAE